MNRLTAAITAAIAAAVTIATPVQAQQCMSNGWCFGSQSVDDGSRLYTRTLDRSGSFVLTHDRWVGTDGTRDIEVLNAYDCQNARHRVYKVLMASGWETVDRPWKEIMPGSNGANTLETVCR